MISALLIDDEAAANQHLRQLLAVHPQVNILGAVASVAEAIAFLAEQTPDVIFLDVNMPGRTGLELLPELATADMAVVFVTAHENYAIPAFDAGAVDYLVKPVNPQRLALMIPRLVTAVARRHQPPAEETRQPALALDDRISFPVCDSKSLRICRRCDIVWIEAMQNYTRIQIKNHPTALSARRSMGEWEALLGEPDFYRLSRFLLIRLDSLRSIEWNPRSQSRLALEGAAELLSIGRQAAARLKEILVQREAQ